MAKKHKNLDNIPIQWDGTLTDPPYGAGNKNQSVPTNVEILWGGHPSTEYYPDTDCPKRQQSRTEPECWWEDYDWPSSDGVFNVADLNWWTNTGGGNGNLIDVIGSPSVDGGTATSNGYLTNLVLQTNSPTWPKKVSDGYGPNTYTWGDFAFVIEIADGLGSGRRRRERLNNLVKNEDIKKKLIHLICRVKGEKVYDKKKEVSGASMNIKLEDVDLVINEVLGKIKVETKDVL